MDTVCRFLVCSDIHYKVDSDTEIDRFETGMRCAFAYAKTQTYNSVDALFVVGDFANSGNEPEMLKFKASLKCCIGKETRTVLSMASHEYFSDGETAAHERFKRIFHQPPDVHEIIRGFHFISLTTEQGCHIKEKKQFWLRNELRQAAKEDPHRPIFVFQHPHLSGTVYGSINWGEDEIIPILMDYPQVIDFSGHSHAPINDPRSIHQRYFTSVGTGSFSYFELDEFDFNHGTIPPDASQCAQFHIVEVNADSSVRILPFDVISKSFFIPYYEVKTAWEPASFLYTDARYRTCLTPQFAENAEVAVRVSDRNVQIVFPQAEGTERPDSYTLLVREAETGVIRKQIKISSSYYLQNMPQEKEIDFTLDHAGTYSAALYANSFWRTASEPLRFSFVIN